MKQFENLEDPDVYDECEQWWIDEFNKRFQGDFIINYLNTWRDGNPIFCVINKDKRVRVIWDWEDTEHDFVSGYFKQNVLGTDNIELVICTSMTEENTNQAFTWIKDWFDNNLTEKDLQDHFDNNNTKKKKQL